MAFDHAGFFAIIGKYVKLVDQADGYIDAIESRKVEIRDIYDTEGILDTYISLPPLVASMQQNVTAWIDALVADISNLLLNREYVIEQLPISEYSTVSILNAIYDYMDDNSVTIESSVVSLGGGDVDEATTGSEVYPNLFVSRILDGINAPGNGVSAHKRYVGLEGQLARTTTEHARVTSSLAGQEIAELFSLAEETRPYVFQDEEPGSGGNIVTAEAANSISNYKFNSWDTGTPVGWSFTGTPTTDYLDISGTGIGPVRFKTAGIKASQQITGLTKNKMYFVAVHFQGYSTAGLANGSSDTGAFTIRVRNLSDTLDYMGDRVKSITIPDDTPSINYPYGTTAHGQAYGFFYLDDNVDLNNVYLEIEATDMPASTYVLLLKKVVLTEALYWNGLAHAWWAPEEWVAGVGGKEFLAAVGTTTSIAVANNDNGVFQRFFRKAFNIQLPTDDSPTINDSLAV